MPAPFNGALKSNEIFSAIYNMIIGQEVFANNIAGTSSKLLEMAKKDAGMYGDQKLFYETEVLNTHPWLGDSETANLLSVDRPQAPFCQAIVIDKFRQIRLTVDNYLSKRAWGDEYAFSQFTSVMLGWLSDTRRVYESTLINSFVGKTETALNGQTVTLVEPDLDASATNVDTEAYNRLYAETIAEGVANEFVKLTDINRINDLGFMRSWNYDDLAVVWNSDAVEKIKRIDMPTLFHKDGLIDKFEEVVLPAKYWAKPTTATVTVSAVNSATQTYYVCKECSLQYISGTDTRTVHAFPGDVVATSTQSLIGSTSLPFAKYIPDGTTTATTTILAGDVGLMATDTPVCKIIHKDSLQFLSGWEANTEFVNPRALNENHYVTLAHSEPTYLKGKPIVTVKIAPAT